MEQYIGLLYSTETGIVLRTINPDQNDQYRLTWLQDNKPDGTTLLLLKKKDIGADEYNCPNLDYLIPHVKNKHNIDLGFGKAVCIVGPDGVVKNVIHACPTLHKKHLKIHKPDHHVIDHTHGEIGDTYDFDKKDFHHNIRVKERLAREKAEKEKDIKP